MMDIAQRAQWQQKQQQHSAAYPVQPTASASVARVPVYNQYGTICNLFNPYQVDPRTMLPYNQIPPHHLGVPPPQFIQQQQQQQPQQYFYPLPQQQQPLPQHSQNYAQSTQPLFPTLINGPGM